MVVEMVVLVVRAGPKKLIVDYCAQRVELVFYNFSDIE
jgi:hypothetical protein